MKPDTTSPEHPPYRPDIDGLRAVAILLVLGFHAFPAWAPGGFIGVDIFFVISGFLISGILLANLRGGHFSLAGFYARRIRRIFPALILVLAATAAFGFFVLWPGEYRYLGKHIAGGAGFIVNFMLARESGYFEGLAETKPLLHLWSLGVEEQFYIFWPLMLWAAWKWKHRAGVMIAMVIMASFGADLYLAAHRPVVDFYSPLSRFWELLAGGALAWVAQNRPALTPSRMLANFCAVGGTAAIVLAALAFDKDTVFPGWLALLPVGGACLVIAAGQEAWVNRKILAHPASIGIGLISYPLYLWHWPLLSFAQILSGENPGRDVRMAMIALAFVLAALTYKFVERPIRKSSLSLKNISLMLAVMIAMGGIGGIIWHKDGLPLRFADGGAAARALDNEYLTLAWQHDVRYHECHLQEPETDRQAPECIEAARPLLLLWGDSHAASLYPGLARLQEQNSFGIAQLTQAGCPPILDTPHLVFRPNCNVINRRILGQAAQLQPAVIILAAAWSHHDYPMENADIVARLSKTIAKIKQASPQAKIIVVGPQPRWESPLPAIYRRALSFEHRTPPARLGEHLDRKLTQLDEMMRAQFAAGGVDYLSPQQQLCDASGCLTRLGDGLDSLTFIDQEHVTAAGADFLIGKFAPDILGGLGIAQK